MKNLKITDKKMENILMGLTSKIEDKELMDLIDNINVYEKYISELELDNFQLTKHIEESFRMLRILQLWLKKDMFSTKQSIINFINVTLKKML